MRYLFGHFCNLGGVGLHRAHVNVLYINGSEINMPERAHVPHRNREKHLECC